MHITSSWGLKEFYRRNELLASNNTAIASAPHQWWKHLLKGALLLANSTTDLLLFWRLSTFSRVLYYSPTAQRTCYSSGDSSCRLALHVACCCLACCCVRCTSQDIYQHWNSFATCLPSQQDYLYLPVVPLFHLVSCFVAKFGFIFKFRHFADNIGT